ncbi:hypothetical protein EN814_34060, partial [Mesorhizobium sp. M2D.F.Ca.ET.171.01.1.1]
LPKTMEEALDRFAVCEPVKALLGEDFFQTYLRVKSVELDLFQVFVSVRDEDKKGILPAVKRLAGQGFKVLATSSTLLIFSATTPFSARKRAVPE